MALPVVSTAERIVAEAFKKAKIPSPGLGEITRATEEYLEDVKKSMTARRSWKILEETSVLILDDYVSRYAVDANFNKAVELMLYYGQANTMQTVGAASFTLEASEELTLAQALGSPIFITNGNAKAEMSRIVTYNTTSKAGTVSPNFGTTPSGTPTYLVPTSEVPLPYNLNNNIRYLDAVGIPRKAVIYDNDLFLSPVTDSDMYAIILQHQVRIHKIDLTDARITRVYEDWYPALWRGVWLQIILGKNDDQEAIAKAEYEAEIVILEAEDDRKRRMGWR